MNDDFRTYNDDTSHNMWVDYTGEQYENRAVCHSYDHICRHEASMSRDMLRRCIATPAKSLGASENRISCINEQIRRYRQSLASQEQSIGRITSQRKLKIYQYRLAETRNNITNLQQQQAEEEANWCYLKTRNIRLQILLVLAVCIGLTIYFCL